MEMVIVEKISMAVQEMGENADTRSLESIIVIIDVYQLKILGLKCNMLIVISDISLTISIFFN